jgi:ATP-dependent helicase/nuclease subunit A
VGPPDPDDDAVRVMTIHGSKGLEFPIVVLAGLEREVAPGQRPPAVLWGEDGTPELRAGGRLRSLRFDEAHERERALDALEQHRLLYVGMTRARDHLVLCLHHKETRDGPARTEAALAYDICLRNPQLWRRLPIPALTGDETAEPFPPAHSPAPTDPAPAGSSAEDAEMARWRHDVEAFATRRADALASTRRAPVTTATAVATRLGSALGTALDGPDPGSPDAAGAPWRDADTALQLGRAVHSALAAIDLSTGTDDAGRSAPEVARGRAAAQGIPTHADAVAAMVEAALASPTVMRGATRRHWRELFVAVPVGGGVLEGFVDLVLEEDDGLVVVDYKTDRIASALGLASAAARYRPQVASYALALQQATGRSVHRCVLVFVGNGAPAEDVLEGVALDEARRMAQQAAGELVAALTPAPGSGEGRAR